MRCPFPGMDPYLEQPEIWPDFHDSLITCIRGLLQPLLRPRYAALTQDRLYVVEAERPIRPDVAVIEAQVVGGSPDGESSTATISADAPSAVFDLRRDEVREPVIHIIEPAQGNRIVTAIEVLSPDNKTPGTGRLSYLQKRDEYWNGHVNLVEIDLLRSGGPTVRVSAEKLASVEPFHYLTAVTRVVPCQQFVYAIQLRQRLPRVPVPLDESDVPLDLQAAFERCWDEGPYPELLHYDHNPPGELSDDEITWARETASQYGSPTS